MDDKTTIEIESLYERITELEKALEATEAGRDKYKRLFEALACQFAVAVVTSAAKNTA